MNILYDLISSNPANFLGNDLIVGNNNKAEKYHGK